MPGPLGPLEKWGEGCRCCCGSSSVPKSGMTLCKLMDYSMPESPVLHYLLVKMKVLVTESCTTPCSPMDCSPPGSSVHGILQARILEWVAISFFRSLLKFLSIEWVMLSNHLILCLSFSFCPQSFPASESFPVSHVFASGDLKYQSFSFSISPSNEYAGLISFRINWFDLLAVQGTLKSLLQHHSSKCQFFSPQPSLWSNPHIHTWLLEKP